MPVPGPNRKARKLAKCVARVSDSSRDGYGTIYNASMAPRRTASISSEMSSFYDPELRNEIVPLSQVNTTRTDAVEDLVIQTDGTEYYISPSAPPISPSSPSPPKTGKGRFHVRMPSLSLERSWELFKSLSPLRKPSTPTTPPGQGLQRQEAREERPTFEHIEDGNITASGVDMVVGSDAIQGTIDTPPPYEPEGERTSSEITVTNWEVCGQCFERLSPLVPEPNQGELRDCLVEGGIDSGLVCEFCLSFPNSFDDFLGLVSF